MESADVRDSAEETAGAGESRKEPTRNPAVPLVALISEKRFVRKCEYRAASFTVQICFYRYNLLFSVHDCDDDQGLRNAERQEGESQR